LIRIDYDMFGCFYVELILHPELSLKLDLTRIFSVQIIFTWLCPNTITLPSIHF